MLPEPKLRALIELALAEDIGSGDLTTQALFPDAVLARADFRAREPLVVSGLEVAQAIFERLEPTCRFEPRHKEGSKARRGDILARVQGPIQALLTGERTALNFVRHLSGIATLTRRYVDLLEDSRCRLLDTRKTTPGMRALEKAAVRAGGGHNHRMGLFDGVMIKDNHIAAAGSICRAVEAARRRVPPTIKVEVECDTLAQVEEALAAGADLIMLDNMSPAEMARAVRLVAGRALTEASGGIDLTTVRAAALAGVDFVSVGALTHSAPSVDIGLDFVKTRPRRGR